MLSLHSRLTACPTPSTSAPRGRSPVVALATPNRGAPAAASTTPAAARLSSAIARINAAPARTLAIAAATAEAPPMGRASEAVSSSDKYAVVEIGGVQMLVEEGRWYTCNRLEANAGATIALGRVLALKSAGAFSVGTPYLAGVTVEATVLDDEAQGPKEVIFKMHSKKHYRRKTGHRQPLTKFMVTKITGA